MRIFLTLISLFFVLHTASSQDSLAHFGIDWGTYHYNDIYFGFNKSPKVDSLNAAYHSIEFGFWQSFVSKHHHAASGTVYLGQELGFSKKQFIHGTKLGLWGSANAIIFGFELSHHTNYTSHAFNFWPSLGFGLYPLRLSASFRVRLSGKSFQPVNKVNFNVAFPLFRLKERKEEVKVPTTNLPDVGMGELRRNN